MTSLKTSIKTITYLSDIGCLEIQGASLESNSTVSDTDNTADSENEEATSVENQQAQENTNKTSLRTDAAELTCPQD